jgi:predicted RNA methylase
LFSLAASRALQLLAEGAGLDDTLRVFTSYDIQTCLYDERRVEYFQRAIEAMVKPGDVVVDAGSGTGLLGLLAVKAGARKVYCLELNAEYVKVIGENARRNGMDGQVEAIYADATTYALPENVDVIISEVISAGFFYEPQLQILANLKQFLKPGGLIIPIAMENYVELINAQDQLYGLTFSYDPRFRDLPGDVALTDRQSYLKTTFTAETAPSIAEKVRLRAISSGRANAVRITYRVTFAEGVSADQPTEFLLNPQIIFLCDKVELTKGQSYNVSIEYESSSSPLNSKIKLD